jgi:hypothetical protein
MWAGRVEYVGKVRNAQKILGKIERQENTSNTYG